MQWEEIAAIVGNAGFWDRIKVCIKVLTPAVMVLRYADGMRGGSLGLIYSLLLQLVELYKQNIPGLPDAVRVKVSPLSSSFKQSSDCQ